MKTYAKAYLMFVAFSIVTAVVVRPMVKNVPLLNTI